MNIHNSTLQFSHIRKSFGSAHVLRGTSGVLNGSEITLLLGANGAGKSTLLRLFSGLARPDEGAIHWDSERKSPTGKVGYAAHESLLYQKLTVEEYFSMCLRINDCCGEELGSAFDRWNISKFKRQRIETLSRGVQARVSLCRAMFFSPQFVLLDEPSSNLDDPSVEILLESTRLAASSGAVVAIATHDLARMQKVAQRALVLHNGEIYKDSNSDSLGCEKLFEEYRMLNR